MLNNIFFLTRNIFAPKHYIALMVSMLTLTVLAPLIDHFYWTRIVMGVVFIFSVFTATKALTGGSRALSLVFMLAILCIAFWMFVFIFKLPIVDKKEFEIIALSIALLFFATTGSMMWHDVFSGEATANRICGAVCIYVLIGFCFALMHLITALSDPYAYRDFSIPAKISVPGNLSSTEDNYPFFVYFSFCTLTTVGYGDIFPVSRAARTLAWLESVTGQLYLAILVARLVGQHLAIRISKTMTTVNNIITEQEE